MPNTFTSLCSRGSRHRIGRGPQGKTRVDGPAGSETDLKALRVLEAHDITPHNLGTRLQLDDADAAQALKDGKLDALALDAALPAPLVLDLAATIGVKVRLIP